MSDDSRLFLMVRNSLFQHKLPHNPIIHFPRVRIAHMITETLYAFLNLFKVNTPGSIFHLQFPQAMFPPDFAMLLQPSCHGSGFG